MTSEEITKADLTIAEWCREIAYQLALLNEANSRRDIRNIQELALLRKDAEGLGRAEPGKRDTDREPGELSHQVFQSNHSHCCHCGLEKKYWRVTPDCLGRAEQIELTRTIEHLKKEGA